MPATSAPRHRPGRVIARARPLRHRLRGLRRSRRSWSRPSRPWLPTGSWRSSASRPGSRPLRVDMARLNQAVVLYNRVIVGSAAASWDDYAAAVATIGRAEAGPGTRAAGWWAHHPPHRGLDANAIRRHLAGVRTSSRPPSSWRRAWTSRRAASGRSARARDPGRGVRVGHPDVEPPATSTEEALADATGPRSRREPPGSPARRGRTPARLPSAPLAGLPHLLRGHALPRPGHVDAAGGHPVAGGGARRHGGEVGLVTGCLLPADPLRGAAGWRAGRPGRPAQRPDRRAALSPRSCRG